jgi:hypothetical protein
LLISEWPNMAAKVTRSMSFGLLSRPRAGRKGGFFPHAPGMLGRVWRLPVRFSFAANKPEKSRKPSAPASLCERQYALERIAFI